MGCTAMLAGVIVITEFGNIIVVPCGPLLDTPQQAKVVFREALFGGVSSKGVNRVQSLGALPLVRGGTRTSMDSNPS